MRASLENRLRAQIDNEAALRKGRLLEYEEILKLAALMYYDASKTVDVNRLKECKDILKSKVGMFSNFRGWLQYLIQVKMALSDNPEAYIDGVLRVYDRLKEGLFIPGEPIAMTATTIFENCPAEKLTDVVDKTRATYAKVKEQHRFLTDENDMALIALIVMAGLDSDEAAARAEELYQALKGNFLPTSDTPQTAAMVLSVFDKPTDKAVADFFELYDAVKAVKHHTGKGIGMAIYAAYAELEADFDEIAEEIGQVDDWLKNQKGYGMMGVGKETRRLLAATFVLEDRQKDTSIAGVSTTNAVTQAIVEEILLILITIIVTMIICGIVSSQTSSSH